MSTNLSTDLRVRRTRKWLQSALLVLMKEKPFDEIQITEIADRAEVSRPAFYLHFRSKEELLLSHMDGIFDEFITEVGREITSSNLQRKQICILLFQYWAKYADSLQMLMRANIQNVLMQRIRRYVFVVINEFRRQEQKRLLPTNSIEDLHVDFVAGGAYMLLQKWLEDKMPYPAERMGELFYELTLRCENYS